MFDDFFAISLVVLPDGSLVHAEQCCCMACWSASCGEQDASTQQDEQEDCDLWCQCPVCCERMLIAIEETSAIEQRRRERLRCGW